MTDLTTGDLNRVIRAIYVNCDCRAQELHITGQEDALHVRIGNKTRFIVWKADIRRLGATAAVIAAINS